MRNRINPNDHQLSLVVYDAPPDLPATDRPHTRLLRDGPEACSAVELIQVIIGGANAEFAARSLLNQCRDLRGLAACTAEQLARLVHGVSHGKAAQLKAALELGRRMMTSAEEARPMIKTPADAAQLLMLDMALLEQEEIRTMLLDTRTRLMATPMIYRGSLCTASMRVGEMFKEAIRSNAASIIVAHNHPSGDPTPTAQDVTVTKTLVAAGKLLDVEVLDHLVIGHNRYVSLREKGLGFDALDEVNDRKRSKVKRR